MKAVSHICEYRLLIFGALVLFLISPASAQNTDTANYDKVSGGTNKEAQKTIQEKDTFSFVGVGDMMLGTNFPDSKDLPPFPPAKLFKPVNHILKDADVTFGNLESSLMDSGELIKDCEVDSLCYAFRMPADYVSAFREAGFDLISLANNHSGDFGTAGRKQTVKVLDTSGIQAAGLNFLKTTSLEVKGKTIGFVAFSPNNGTPRIEKIAKAKDLVKELDEKSNIVVVSFHGGAEGSDHQHVTREVEKYYGENRGNVYKFAHSMIDAGGDVIFGHGPHVPRAMELYKDRIIAYSLGNFCTYAKFNISGVNGLAPILRVQTNERGAFIEGKIISARQKGEGGPHIDSRNRAAKKIRNLTKADFPKTPLKIKPGGLLVNPQAGK